MERLETTGFDIVLMDINMPGMTGIDTVKMLRFMHPAERLPPIVAVSADATPETRAACRDIGFSGYLTKPIERHLVLRTIDELTAQPDQAAAPEPAPSAPADESNVVPHPALDMHRPVLDQRKLASLAELDTGDGFLTGLIDDFLEDARAIARTIEQAAEAGQAKRIRDQAHALRSSAAHLGASALFALCLSWRELDDDALLLRSRTELRRLRVELDRLELALAEFRPTPPASPQQGRA
jgi:two-component system sensor histidine kinase RpfC